MNKFIGIGRLVRDPDIRYSQGKNGEKVCITRFSLAIDRKTKVKNGEKNCDFISCIAFGKTGEFVEKFLKMGIKIALEGHIQTGSYTNKENQKVYTTDVIADSIEFVESKKESQPQPQPQAQAQPQNFVSIPDGIENDLPFI